MWYWLNIRMCWLQCKQVASRDTTAPLTPQPLSHALLEPTTVCPTLLIHLDALPVHRALTVRQHPCSLLHVLQVVT